MSSLVTVRSSTLACSSACSVSLSEHYFTQSHSGAQSCHSYWQDYWQLFLYISSNFQVIPGYSMQFQAIPCYPMLFHAIPGYSSQFQPFQSIKTNYIFFHRLWLCVSEAVRLEGCFPLEPKVFCKLTVTCLFPRVKTRYSFVQVCFLNEF